MAALDFAVFAVLVLARSLAPIWANVASRLVAVACQATFRRDYWTRLRRLTRAEGTGWCAAAFSGHLALTTLLIGVLTALGAPAIPAKFVAQLVGYLAAFVVVDRVLLRRTVRAANR
jgi:putative flippase GtrA